VILYWFLINILYFNFRTYFRRIYITNVGLIPKGKPVLLAPNHPNSFIDGILLSVLLRRKLSLLARGDVFKKPLANKALRSMRLLPIFRAEDVKGEGDQSALNQKTFDECYELFRKNGMVLIFPEGYCVSERRLRPMKKGAAKMAFEAIEKYPNLDLQVVPVGLNYSASGHFREEVCINFGKPIAAQKYIPLIKEGKQNKAITDFNATLYEAMEREMVIIKEPANDAVANKYLIMARNHYKPGFFGFFKNTKKRFLAEKRAANDLNALSDTNHEGFETFRRSVTDYFENLKKLNIKDKYFALPIIEKILYLLFTIALLIPSICGLLLNIIPIRLARNIARKKVRKIEFYDSVYSGASAIIGFFYSLILLIICCSLFGWIGILLTIGIRLLGYLYLFWQEAALNTKYWFVITLTQKGRRMKNTLISQRKFILDYFG
jgi:glycerol-3-phosphate O-acyltransferase/dihydroxyacetone phosphate acyltransferase